MHLAFADINADILQKSLEILPRQVVKLGVHGCDDSSVTEVVSLVLVTKVETFQFSQ